QISEVFMWIAAAIIMGLILYFGVKTAFKLQSTGNQVALNTEIQNLKDDVEKYYYLDKGSSKKITFSFPSEIKYVCFSNGKSIVKNKDIDPGIDFLVKEEAKKEDGNNLFLIPLDSYSNTAFYIPYLNHTSQNLLCFENGKQAFILSQGSYVDIKSNI
ncbi:MAG: hypothetical protein PHT54_03795, partial [Candidatus Nanoarchaeia archaeon]|nr:hypothetical protein [Candidatus Nanoarchaeia archaeon]